MRNKNLVWLWQLNKSIKSIMKSIIKCEYPSDDPIQQVDINNVNISSSIALSKDGAIYELQTK